MVTCLAPKAGPRAAKIRLKARIAPDGRVITQWYGGDSDHASLERHAREAVRFVYLHPLRDAAADLRPGRDNKLIGLISALAVEPGDLPNALERWAVAEGAVGAPLVVMAHPVWQ